MTIRKVIGTNLVLSVGAFVFTGMLLDGGVLNIQVSVGIVMFWLSFGVVGLIRLIQRRKTSLKELTHLQFASLMFMVIAMLANIALLAIDWTPGWMQFAELVRS